MKLEKTHVFFPFFLCVCVGVYKCMQKRASDLLVLGLQAVVNGQMWGGFWKRNLGPLEEKQVFLTGVFQGCISFFFSRFIYFMVTGFLPVLMYVCHGCASYPQWPEEGDRSPGMAITGGCESLCGNRKLNLASLSHLCRAKDTCLFSQI